MLNADRSIKVALLDLYDSYPNTEMRNFEDILGSFKNKHQLNLTWQIFDVRGKTELPGTGFDIYISSGGPGSPVDSEGTEWDNKFFDLIAQLEAHNATDDPQKKHILLVCHSFQLMCRHLRLSKVTKRDAESFGIFPVHKTAEGGAEELFKGLNQQFYVMDMREWECVEPNEQIFKQTGAKLAAIEMERARAGLPKAMMAVRFNEYCFGTQFHPEVGAALLKEQMLDDEFKQRMIAEYNEEIYWDTLNQLDDDSKLALTQSTIVPQFLTRAVNNFWRNNILM